MCRCSHTLLRRSLCENCSMIRRGYSCGVHLHTCMHDCLYVLVCNLWFAVLQCSDLNIKEFRGLFQKLDVLGKYSKYKKYSKYFLGTL